jgi:hypothetical protein
MIPLPHWFPDRPVAFYLSRWRCGSRASANSTQIPLQLESSTKKWKMAAETKKRKKAIKEE